VTVKIVQDVGVDYIRDYAKKLGITSPLYHELSMALGSSSLSLFELTKAYAVFANQENLSSLYSLRRFWIEMEIF